MLPRNVIVPNAYPAKTEHTTLVPTTTVETSTEFAMYFEKRPSSHATAKFSRWRPPAAAASGLAGPNAAASTVRIGHIAITAKPIRIT